MRHIYTEKKGRTVVVLANGEECVARELQAALSLAERIARRTVLYMVGRSVQRAST